ncbi:hypothetical protein RCL_jg23780.t1 [Rhizophagus clarus]|uniref:Uncharacterized protein n=1 Tax=Rhizophagus clarus TaxID=94130 RepID=A0A8H3LK20_9GLOM|nr:hypothetical protein RCL_jg23780.t1 [Rhizophagus clarus]
MRKKREVQWKKRNTKKSSKHWAWNFDIVFEYLGVDIGRTLILGPPLTDFTTELWNCKKYVFLILWAQLSDKHCRIKHQDQPEIYLSARTALRFLDVVFWKFDEEMVDTTLEPFSQVPLGMQIISYMIYILNKIKKTSRGGW